MTRVLSMEIPEVSGSDPGTKECRFGRGFRSRMSVKIADVLGDKVSNGTGFQLKSSATDFEALSILSPG